MLVLWCGQKNFGACARGQIRSSLKSFRHSYPTCYGIYGDYSSGFDDDHLIVQAATILKLRKWSWRLGFLLRRPLYELLMNYLWTGWKLCGAWEVSDWCLMPLLFIFPLSSNIFHKIMNCRRDLTFDYESYAWNLCINVQNLCIK